MQGAERMLHKLTSVEDEAETVNAVCWGVWDKCRGYMAEGVQLLQRTGPRKG